jgi:hypothetical protein
MEDRMHDLDDDPPTVTAPIDKLAIRRPDIPVTLGELAALKGEALEIVDARVQILETLRKASIRATSPEDWVLFKAREEDGGQVVGYLEDSGCERVRALWGVRIYNISPSEKIVGNDPADFMILITGDGECAITHEIVEQMEGGRSSKDDFCRDKTGAALELAVRKAARANLDGGVVRELTGMRSVPLQELEAAWVGTSKTIDRCRKGRGFGSHDARLGGVEAADLGLVPPTCNVCGKPMQLRKSARGQFYSCNDYKAHGRDAHTWDLEKWRQQPASRKPATTPLTPAQAAGFTGAPTAPAGRVERELRDDEVFGNGRQRDREPGEEG